MLVRVPGNLPVRSGCIIHCVSLGSACTEVVDLERIDPTLARAIVIDPLSPQECVQRYLRRPEFIAGTGAYKHRILGSPLGRVMADEHRMAIPFPKAREAYARVEETILGSRRAILESPSNLSEKALLSSASVGKDGRSVDADMECSLLVNNLRVRLRRIYDSILDSLVVRALCAERSVDAEQALAGLGLEPFAQGMPIESSAWRVHTPQLCRLLADTLKVGRGQAVQFIDGLYLHYFGGGFAEGIGTVQGWYFSAPNPAAVEQWVADAVDSSPDRW